MKKVFGAYSSIAILVFSMLTLFPKWIVDDAYISFRYAENLVMHGEFTFNVGEDPVEGYTGVLLPIGIALALHLGIRPEIAAHFIGILSFLVLLVVFHKILTRLRLPLSLRLLVFLLFATAPFLYTHVFSGLETIAFTALLLASTLRLHAIIHSGATSFLPYAMLALLLLLLSLCRPEGVVYAVIAFCVLGYTTALRITSGKAFIRSFLVFLVFPGALYFIWRWQYYGFLLPNTFYAKQSTTLSGRSLHELAYFCMQYLLLPTITLIVTLSLSPYGTWKQIKKIFFQPQRRAGMLTVGSLVIFGVIIVMQYIRSNLLMNFSHRFFVPLYPIGLFLLLWFLSPLLDNVLDRPVAWPMRHRLILLGLLTIFSIQMAFHVNWLLKKEIPFAFKYKTRLSEMARPAGLYLERHVPESEWLIVHFDAGAIPFYSGLRTVDFGGLNDEYLAHNQSASLKDRVDYFFARRPGAVVFTSYEWERVTHGYEASMIVSDPRFKRYKLVKKFANSTGKQYFEFVFLRNDLLAKPGS